MRPSRFRAPRWCLSQLLPLAALAGPGAALLIVQSLSAPILEQLPSFIISDLPGVGLKLEVAVAQLQKAQAQTGVYWIQSEKGEQQLA